MNIAEELFRRTHWMIHFCILAITDAARLAAPEGRFAWLDISADCLRYPRPRGSKYERN